MFNLLAAFLAAQLANGSAAQPFDLSHWYGRVAGSCSYSQAVQERTVSDILILCNQAEIDDSGIALSSRSWGLRARFSGHWSGDNLTVNSIVLRDNPTMDATGTCQLYFTDEHLSVLSCVAVAQGRSYVANFVTSRL